MYAVSSSLSFSVGFCHQPCKFYVRAARAVCEAKYTAACMRVLFECVFVLVSVLRILLVFIYTLVLALSHKRLNSMTSKMTRLFSMCSLQSI